MRAAGGFALTAQTRQKQVGKNSRPILTRLSFFAKEKQRHGAGAGMVSDDRPHIIDVDVFDTQTAAHLIGHKPGVLQTVAMADEHSLVFRVNGGFRHFVHQRRQGRFAAPRLADGDQAALIIYVHHRLDGQHGAEQRRGGADAPAPLQVVQIVHREPVAEMGTDLLGISLDLFNGLALFLLLRAV